MRSQKTSIVIADDDASILDVLEHHLKRWGHRARLVQDKTQLLEAMEQERPTLLLLDLRFGEHDGVEVMRELLARDPQLNVVLMTAYGSIDNAVAAIKLGAYDYLTKPPDLDRLNLTISHALEKHGLKQKIEKLEKLVETQEVERRMLGNSDAMRRLRHSIARVADSGLTVLVQGESGTGKELVAHALHMQSSRRDGPMIPVNMAALPRELAESTLFGHVKGSFTGADRDLVGCCEAADGGTLFLDEIGEMDLVLQAKLLRFLQEKVVQRVGSAKTITVDVRIVAATNLNLLHQVKSGLFREDLYYRLNVVPVTVPPLRERREDIPILAKSFLALSAERMKNPAIRFSPEVLSRMVDYHWPGNVRELKHFIEHVVVFCETDEITLANLPGEWLINQKQAYVRENKSGLTTSSSKNLPKQNGMTEFVPAGEKIGDPDDSPITDFSPAADTYTDFSADSDADSDSDSDVDFADAEPHSKITDIPGRGQVRGAAEPVGGMGIPGADDRRRWSNGSPTHGLNVRPPEPTGVTIQDMERQAIIDALRKTQGHVAKAALILKISRATIYRKLQRYEINPDAFV